MKLTEVCVLLLLGLLNLTDLAQFSIDFSFDKDELLVMEDDILLVLFNRTLSYR